MPVSVVSETGSDDVHVASSRIDRGAGAADESVILRTAEKTVVPVAPDEEWVAKLAATLPLLVLAALVGGWNFFPKGVAAARRLSLDMNVLMSLAAFGSDQWSVMLEGNLARDLRNEPDRWQISYAEIWVTDTLWPDFRCRHLLEAIIDYQKRDRRYGGITQPVVAGR